MIDKDFCLSSYIAYRYIYKDDVDFFEGIKHENYKLLEDSKKIFIENAKQIDESIKHTIEKIYDKYNKVGILLSGGMDSAIIASYLKEGSYAYTFSNKDTDIYNKDIERSNYYCKKLGLNHVFVEIDFNDYKKYTPIVMKEKGAPVHSIEPQIYKACMQAKEDGVEVMLIGDGADYVFGGMDKLLSGNWTYESFIERYMAINPKDVLVNPVDGIDILEFMDGPVTIESYSSYENAFKTAKLDYCDPYDIMKMKDKLDLDRIRKGESKYLIRELFKMRYPELEVPTKIPMPRPVDKIFENWEGPKRKEFRKDIDMNKLTGNQKWQLWCAELFLNIND